MSITEGYYRKNSDDLLNSEATIVVELASVRPSSLDFQEANDAGSIRTFIAIYAMDRYNAFSIRNEWRARMVRFFSRFNLDRQIDSLDIANNQNIITASSIKTTNATKCRV